VLERRSRHEHSFDDRVTDRATEDLPPVPIRAMKA
jgi:hypothetical protein